MPELPEVETVARDLRKRVVGAKIRSVRTTWPRHFSRSPGGFARLAREATGKTIKNISRTGKRIIFQLSGGKALVAHLKMTGAFLWREAGQNDKHVRVIFELSNGKLYFSDIRKFGRFIFGDEVEVEALPDMRLGPDALTVNFEEFKKRLKARRGSVKNLLLDQSVIAGIGNIYADEILHASRVHPMKRTERLKENELKNIWRHMRLILARSIKSGGTSMRDFRNIEGKKGGYLAFCKVYGRAGKRCHFRCGGIIIRIKLGARSAHFCPKCQPS